MSRIIRVVIVGRPHHVTQRGNHRQKVFHEEGDYSLYLELLRKHFDRYGVSMPGFALMPNHVHEILVPSRQNSLAKGVGCLHHDFAFWQQAQRNLTGHLWQNRFFSSPMDDDYFWKGIRYAELNPVRAGLVRFAWDWPWSSARAHVTGIDETGLLDMDIWRERFDPGQWKQFLEQGLNAAKDNDFIRRASRTGRPLGCEDFVRRLESITGRVLIPQKRGPKPNKGA
jgi:putative transposase